MITFRGAGAWGAGKGSNLTAAEVDENFWDLWSQIQADTDEAAVGIASISVLASQMTVNLQDGRALGPFTLPTATFSYQGDWVALHAYATLDIVRVVGSGLYLSLQAHISAATFDPAEENTEGAIYLKLFDAKLAGPSTGWAGVRNVIGTDIDNSSELTLDRAGYLYRCHNDASTTFWLPEDTDIAYPIGTILGFEVATPYGHVTISSASGGTEHRPTQSLTASEHYALVIMEKVAANVWHARGDLDP